MQYNTGQIVPDSTSTHDAAIGLLDPVGDRTHRRYTSPMSLHHVTSTPTMTTNTTRVSGRP